MSLREAAGEAGVDVGGQPLLLAKIRSRLDEDDAAWLDEVIDLPADWSARRIALILRAEGHSISESAVQNYRLASPERRAFVRGDR